MSEAQVKSGVGERSPMILPAGLRQEDPGVRVLTQEDMDSGDWVKHDDYASEFEPALSIIMNTQIDLAFDPTKVGDEAKKSSNVGLLKARWSFWKIVLNFQRQWEGNIPPWHLGVAWKDKPVGILSPLQRARTCWKCGVFGWEPMPAEKRLANPSLPARVPRCPVRRPCPGHPNLVPGTTQVLGWTKCGMLDWWGDQEAFGSVSRFQFQVSAKERLQDLEKDEAVGEGMDITFDAQGDAYQIMETK
jgi:hypothetical protein